MRLFSSSLAIDAIIALEVAGSLSLARLAGAIEATPSATQRAISVLLDDGIAARDGRPPTYRLTDRDLTSELVTVALLTRPIDRIAAIAGRANPALEFASLDGDLLTVVFSSRAPTPAIARASRFTSRVAALHHLRTHEFDHRDLRRELMPRPELRDQARRGRLLHGELDRSFPDRQQHGLHRGRPLHRIHPTLRQPSQRSLRKIAAHHGVRSLHLFGSSVRTDFRPDSDVDVLVEFRPDARPTLMSLVQLEDELSEVLDRDADLVESASLYPDIRDRVQREAVRIL